MTVPVRDVDIAHNIDGYPRGECQGGSCCLTTCGMARGGVGHTTRQWMLGWPIGAPTQDTSRACRQRNQVLGPTSPKLSLPPTHPPSLPQSFCPLQVRVAHSPSPLVPAEEAAAPPARVSIVPVVAETSRTRCASPSHTYKLPASSTARELGAVSLAEAAGPPAPRGHTCVWLWAAGWGERQRGGNTRAPPHTRARYTWRLTVPTVARLVAAHHRADVSCC